MQGSLMEEDKKNKKKKTEEELRASWAGRTDIVADVKDGQGYLQSGTIEAIVHWLLDHVEYPPPQENRSNGSFFANHPPHLKRGGSELRKSTLCSSPCPS
jgi:hypothetical protein